ncbi:MAG: hypothetical protein OET90_10360, partial [Desulfuromonadales bacterium]|nr:hypothetical protein [Desulfuromonadales bacterium]
MNVFFKKSVVRVALFTLAFTALSIGQTFATSPSLELISVDYLGDVSATQDGATDYGLWGQGSSTDGQYVAFVSDAKLVDDDTGVYSDAYVRDRFTGETERVSIGRDAQDNIVEANGDTVSATISADGRYVVFMSYATNLDNETTTGSAHHNFMYDRQTQTTTRISYTDTGAVPSNSSSQPTVSSDGRYVAFLSGSSEFSVDDSNGIGDIFLRDTVDETTTLISRSRVTGQAVGGWWPRISANGRYIVFRSNGTHLDAAGKVTSGSVQHIYRYDRENDIIELVS